MSDILISALAGVAAFFVATQIKKNQEELPPLEVQQSQEHRLLDAAMKTAKAVKQLSESVPETKKTNGGYSGYGGDDSMEELEREIERTMAMQSNLNDQLAKLENDDENEKFSMHGGW